jgi:hypothetical protein
VKTLKAIYRGIGYVEGYGSHPGTPFLLILLMAGLLAGGFVGVLIMAIFVVPIYLIGAYDRGKR